jgi:hypothetical protein
VNAPTGTIVRAKSTLETKWSGGRLLHIHIAPAASFEMEEIEEAHCSRWK